MCIFHSWSYFFLLPCRLYSNLQLQCQRKLVMHMLRAACSGLINVFYFTKLRLFLKHSSSIPGAYNLFVNSVKGHWFLIHSCIYGECLHLFGNEVVLFFIYAEGELTLKDNTVIINWRFWAAQLVDLGTTANFRQAIAPKHCGLWVILAVIYHTLPS